LQIPICVEQGLWTNIIQTMADHFSTPIARFFAISLAIHLLLLSLWPNPQKRTKPQDVISVSFLPTPRETPLKTTPLPKKAPIKPTPIPKQAPTRPSRAPAIVAKKSSPILEEKPVAPQASTPKRETKRQEPPPPKPLHEKIAITERPLPTLKELLPPLTWSSAERRDNGQDGPVHLNTKNPQYITYFGSIKRAIELVWQYPEPALRYGLQGKLLLEFSILADGKLASARIIRSSGSNLLDEEAMRAVQAAAPFSPIPPWIDKSRLDIIASFEYLDNRLNYRYMR
jgi:protein TonB